MYPKFYVYSKRGCHLCEELIEQLIEFLNSRAKIEIIDIESSKDLLDKYHADIPVVTFNDKEIFKHFFNKGITEQVLENFNQ
tara:strand:- start:682 stop:927 length:246 start_codon:yes stop_codon:yes gene_type:complete